MTDSERGLKAITYYHSAMRSLYASSFKYSLPEFLEILKKLRGGKALLEGLGLGIREAEISDSRVRTAMDNLAKRGGGKIPASYMDFFYSLTSEAVKVNFIDAAAFVTVGVASDVLDGAQAVGDSVLTSFKVLNFLLPAIILIFVFFFLDGKSGGKLSNLQGRE